MADAVDHTRSTQPTKSEVLDIPSDSLAVVDT